jgi:hypothetical protein
MQPSKYKLQTIKKREISNNQSENGPTDKSRNGASRQGPKPTPRRPNRGRSKIRFFQIYKNIFNVDYNLVNIHSLLSLMSSTKTVI